MYNISKEKIFVTESETQMWTILLVGAVVFGVLMYLIHYISSNYSDGIWAILAILALALGDLMIMAGMVGNWFLVVPVVYMGALMIYRDKNNFPLAIAIVVIAVITIMRLT